MSASRRLLLISPHFPPDASAGAHRVRVLAPYLAAHGWAPTVLTVDPAGHEGALDHELAEATAGAVTIVRVPVVPATSTRRLGLGDLGLRAFLPLYRAARAISADAIFLTTYPVYPAAFGPRLKRALGATLVVDLQDPWVGEWGRTVGGGEGGRPDWKSRASRALAGHIERAVMPHVDGLTSVSSSLLHELAERYPVLAARPRLALPIGMDPRELEWLRAHPRRVIASPPMDGHVHVCYVGTMLPLGSETLDAFLQALARIHTTGGPGAGRLHLHVVGTSNQSDPGAAPRLEARAAQAGVGAWVHETPARIPYLDALRTLMEASIVLVMGTTESRYTASKVQAALASGRPVLAMVHAGSDVARMLAPLAQRDPAIAVLTYTDEHRACTLVGATAGLLAAWCEHPPARLADTRFAPGATGPELAARLADLLEQAQVARG